MKRTSTTYLDNFKKHKVSFPNDRARSIGPFNRDDSFTYVDKNRNEEILFKTRFLVLEHLLQEKNGIIMLILIMRIQIKKEN